MDVFSSPPVKFSVAPSLYAADEKQQLKIPFALGENNPTLPWHIYICNRVAWKTRVCNGISLATLKVTGVVCTLGNQLSNVQPCSTPQMQASAEHAVNN